MTPTNPPKEPLDQRMVTMVSKTHRAQLDAAMRLPGFRSEAQVVRYALDQILPQLLGEAPAPAVPDPQPYKGRTRMLVDTARPSSQELAMREKRVGTPRQPARLRGPVTPAPEPLSETGVADFAPDAKFGPLPTEGLEPYLAVMDEHIREIAGAAQTPTVVEVFDDAVASLGFDPERVATVGSRPGGDVCLECFCVAPHHASTCSLASDSASA